MCERSRVGESGPGLKSGLEGLSVSMSKGSALRKFACWSFGAESAIVFGRFPKRSIPFNDSVFLNHDFTLENGMLTQTMKVKRSEVIRAYRREIEEQY